MKFPELHNLLKLEKDLDIELIGLLKELSKASESEEEEKVYTYRIHYLEERLEKRFLLARITPYLVHEVEHLFHDSICQKSKQEFIITHKEYLKIKQDFTLNHKLKLFLDTSTQIKDNHSNSLINAFYDDLTQYLLRLHKNTRYVTSFRYVNDKDEWKQEDY